MLKTRSLENLKRLDWEHKNTHTNTLLHTHAPSQALSRLAVDLVASTPWPWRHATVIR